MSSEHVEPVLRFHAKDDRTDSVRIKHFLEKLSQLIRL